MSQDDLLKRTASRPDVFGGKPIVRDLRIPVEYDGTLVLDILGQIHCAPQKVRDRSPRRSAG